ncbi:MAG: sensor histidine kinase [Paramuribaculum sp.]|nr:sensor histidine kinase [Paramuribaculum sp.]
MSEDLHANSRRRKVVIFVIHLLCLVILFVLPEVLFNYGRPDSHFSVMAYGKATVFVLAFYIEYYLIIPISYVRKNKALPFIGYNILLILAGELVLFLIISWVKAHMPFGNNFPGPHQVFVHQISVIIKDVGMLILTMALALALKITDNWLKIEARSREEETVRKKQELDGLRNQLNPHFLFNTLNSIYALIDISPSRAQGAVHELSKLLRHVLYDNPAFVSLASEAEFMENYVKLQRLRLTDSAKIQLEVNISGFSESLVPSMLFVTLIENVFKHADFTMPAKISLKVEDNCAIFATENKSRGNATSPSSGIGLDNLTRRLALLYGKDAYFNADASGGRFITRLVVPLTKNENTDKTLRN